jgi:ribosome-binding factor A
MRFERDMDETGGKSIRKLQVGSLLSRVIQDRLSRGIADPRMRGMVSVTGVDLSPDLNTAIVRVSVLPDKYSPRVINALKSATGIFQRQIRSETSLKRVPRLEFRLDESLKRDAELTQSIRDGLEDISEVDDREGLDQDS